MITIALPLMLLAVPRSDDPATFPVLDQETLPAWREMIRPKQDENRWRLIPWRLTLGDGLRAGQRLGKPVLLWAMNGHPLGNT